MALRNILLASAIAITWVALPTSVLAQSDVRSSNADPLPSTSFALGKLVADFSIPFDTFTLPNGLKVIVLTDRSAPMVFVRVNYNVGSTYEPAGRSGFAHLFEHLMFNGSENAPGNYFDHLRDAGVITVNGTTSYDLTNYFEVVPTGSLDRVLFLESDRMGHMLGAVTQAVLDEQRGVVQNEKRNGDNGAASILSYKRTQALYPPGHPYGHSIIGSMKDLNAASLADVHRWFKDFYGPNNATLLIAGDIDLATAKAKAMQYFGAIPAGRPVSKPVAPVPVLAKTIDQTLTGPVAFTSVSRTWPAPGASDADNFVLDAVSGLLTGIDGSPLQEKLVRQDRLFTSIAATNATFRATGEFSIRGTVSEGVDPQVAAKALDAALAAFISKPPSVEALARWKSTRIIPTIRSQENLQSRGGLLMQADSVFGQPGRYKDDLQAYLKITPAMVSAVARKWLTRPSYRAVLKPGPRMTPPDDAPSMAPAVQPPAPTPPSPAAKTGSRGPIPAVGAPGEVRFPKVEHATLANGIPVTYVRHDVIPFTRAEIWWNFGNVDDPAGRQGTNGWMMQLLASGADGRDDHWFAQMRERTGLNLGGASGDTKSNFSVAGPTSTFGEGLRTTMTMLTKPDFPAERIEDTRRLTVSGAVSAPQDAGRLSTEMFYKALAPQTAMAQFADIQTAAEIESITRNDLLAAYHRWVRPEGAHLTIVSNEPLAALLPELNATLGSWKVEGTVQPRPALPARAEQTGAAKIVLIDMPSEVQASITGGQLVDLSPKDEALAPNIANMALGGGFVSRINMNIREDKHWSYGASGGFVATDLGSLYQVTTQVQPDKVGPSIREIRKEVQQIVADKPITRGEFDQSIANVLRQHVASFRSGNELMSSLLQMEVNGWADDFYDGFPGRLNALSLDAANTSLRRHLDPAKWVWVVTGDAKVIAPQLQGLGLPVEIVRPADIVKPG